ncbi:hypothetical protein O3P69_019918 [Scylla paramamosain]|uniref:Uncharacterized protein n=1 Tax=Scylla paramamosain TaxID=85552 RepID=A0AAW0SIK5_SCYPA
MSGGRERGEHLVSARRKGERSVRRVGGRKEWIVGGGREGAAGRLGAGRSGLLVGAWQEWRRDIDTCDVLTVTRRAGQNPQPSTSSSATPPKHGAKPQVILIRGVAGSGKTTLLTFLVSEWLQDPGACTIKHLDEYDIVEVVDLLAGTGVKSCDDWLSMLEDTEVNRTALDCVVRHITSDEREDVTITDSTITSARALLPLIPSKVVRIELSRKESDAQGLIFEHHKYIDLSLDHQYRHPDQATLCDSLLRAMPRSHLERFTGHLSGAGTQLLQEYRGLVELHLAVCDQDAQEVLAAISAVDASLPQLHTLCESVTLRAPHGCLAAQRVILLLSGVDERLLEEAAQIAQLLQPTQRPLASTKFVTLAANKTIPNQNYIRFGFGLLLQRSKPIL